MNVKFVYTKPQPGLPIWFVQNSGNEDIEEEPPYGPGNSSFTGPTHTFPQLEYERALKRRRRQLVGFYENTTGTWQLPPSWEDVRVSQPTETFFKNIEEVRISPVFTTVEYIQEQFGLNMEELSHILCVARSTIYTWRSPAATPRQNTLERINELFVAAKNWSQSGYPNPKVYLNRELVMGKTLFDILQKKPLDQKLVDFAGMRISNKTMLG